MTLSVPRTAVLVVQHPLWLVAVELALDCDETGRAEQIIIETARRTAALYLMQFQYAKEF